MTCHTTKLKAMYVRVYIHTLCPNKICTYCKYHLSFRSVPFVPTSLHSPLSSTLHIYIHIYIHAYIISNPISSHLNPKINPLPTHSFFNLPIVFSTPPQPPPPLNPKVGTPPFPPFPLPPPNHPPNPTSHKTAPIQNEQNSLPHDQHGKRCSMLMDAHSQQSHAGQELDGVVVVVVLVVFGGVVVGLEVEV